jgi:GAF domain-containing protein
MRESLTTSVTRDAQELVDALADDLGQPVGVDGLSYEALAYSSQPENIDAVRQHSILRRSTHPSVSAWLGEFSLDSAREPVRLGPNPALGLRARVCIPVRADDRLLGYLWLLDEPERVSDATIAEAVGRAVEIGAVIQRDQTAEVNQRSSERDVARAIIEGSLAARPDEAILAASPVYVCLVGRIEPTAADGAAPAARALAQAAERVRRMMSPRHALERSTPLESVLILAIDQVDSLLTERAAQFARHANIGAAPDAPRIGVGIGGAVRHPLTLHESYRQAGWAAAEALRGRSPGEFVVGWDDLGVDQAILPLASGRPADEIVPESLRALTTGKDAAMLVETLDAFLEHACESQAAADALAIHRSTLWQRLRRIEEVAGVDLQSGEDRLELHLGLRLWRLTGGDLG